MLYANRREFLRVTTVGLATAGVGPLVLRADAQPTPQRGDAEEYERFFGSGRSEPPTVDMGEALQPTVSQVEGPFYLSGAPYRAKVSPPLAEGVALLITGRVWGFETRKPLARAILDVWHADVHGQYDNAQGSYRNRARMITSESGAYEFETIHPAGYRSGPNFQRTPHIHFKVAASGYKPLTSEMYFEGDPHQDVDRLFKPELLVQLACRETARGSIEIGRFDIVLEAA